MNSSPEALIAARKRLKLTQAQLGIAVLNHVVKRKNQGFAMQKNKGPEQSTKYLQKKVSYWESGHAKPNSEEIAALAEILRVDRESLEQWFSKSPSSADELFTYLANVDRPALLSVCYSARPRAAINQKVFQSLVSGLNRKLSLAMYFPYPRPLPEFQTEDRNLFDMYRDVWRSTKNHYENLRSQIAAYKRDKQLALYVPRASPNEFLVPPYSHRYTLIVEFSGTSDYEESLYTWVESEKIDGLYRVGTFSSLSIRPQIDAWRVYFGAPFKNWIRTKCLEEGEGFWKRFK